MDDPHTSSARRCVSLALWAAVLLAPSAWVAGGLLGAGAALILAPALLRAATHRRARMRADQVGVGIVLGVDPVGRRVALHDGQLAAHALIVGASGAGKSTTLLTVLGAQIRLGRPVIAIDMKGSPAFAAELRGAAGAAGRALRIWTPDGPSHWNPLAHGNATSRKDMLISSERFSEPHYQRAAERYLQTALQVLEAAHPGRAPQLHEVVAVMEPRRLASSLRGAPAPLAQRVQDYLAGMTPDQVSAARGLGTRLAVLSESCAGPYLQPGPGAAGAAIDLRAGLEGGDVILFSLNSSVYGKLAAQLGALAIQDLISASGRRLQAEGPAPPATVAIDEFSALGADNVLALLARGRESGVSVGLATQEMADLERAGRGFRDQVLGIVGVKIIHRQDVPGSAELVAQMAGTARVWEETRHLHSAFSSPGPTRATLRQVERYLVHPNEIKTLATGDAVILTKLPVASVERVRVTPPQRAPAAGASPRGGAPVGGPGGGAPVAGPRGRESVSGPRGRESVAGPGGRESVGAPGGGALPPRAAATERLASGRLAPPADRSRAGMPTRGRQPPESGHLSPERGYPAPGVTR